MDYIFSYNVKYSDQFESINYINCFCESLRRIKFDGKLVIFTESEQRLKSKFNNWSFSLILLAKLSIKLFGSGIVILLFRKNLVFFCF